MELKVRGQFPIKFQTGWGYEIKVNGRREMVDVKKIIPQDHWIFAMKGFVFD